MDHVPDVVKKRRQDHRGRLALRFGQRRRLQRMFELRDGFSP
jgi:hypothetical protein